MTDQLTHVEGIDYSNVAFVDTETTGLDSDHHEVWEIAIITQTSRVVKSVELDGNITEREVHQEVVFQAHLPVELHKADPMALTVGNFYKRRRRLAGPDDKLVSNLTLLQWGLPSEDSNSSRVSWIGTTPLRIASHVVELLDGKHIVGAVPDFDARFLKRFVESQGFKLTHHYHLVDVENLVAAKLGVQPPWKSRSLSRQALGEEVAKEYEKSAHTALGDALWVKALYEWVYSGESTEQSVVDAAWGWAANIKVNPRIWADEPDLELLRRLESLDPDRFESLRVEWTGSDGRF